MIAYWYRFTLIGRVLLHLTVGDFRTQSRQNLGHSAQSLKTRELTQQFDYVFGRCSHELRNS